MGCAAGASGSDVPVGGEGGGSSALGGSAGSSPGSGGAAGDQQGSGGASSGAGGVTGTGGAAAIQDGIRWVGRVDASNPSAVRFSWSGAGLIANVTGTEIAVRLSTTGGSTVYFQAVIDGEVKARFGVAQGGEQTVTLATGLTNGDHLVELYREGEPNFGMSTFHGFASGTVKNAPARQRLVEVVGDSISAGYGNLGEEVHPNWVADPACHQTAENTSWYQTYAAIAGHALDAEVSTVAMSGWGMYRDGGGSLNQVMPKVYGNTLGTNTTVPWSFEHQADVVVINLGTNDWAKGDPGTPYETAYLAFLETVRSKYPDAWIFLTIGSMGTEAKPRLDNVAAAFGDPKVISFDLGTQPLGSSGQIPTGCDWHPNVADHTRMAGILETQFRSKLGW
jgi:lysophospholipase L1-like esterase